MANFFDDRFVSIVPPTKSPRRRGPQPESALQAAIVEAIAASGLAIVWRNNVGLAQYARAKVRYGLAPGSADLVGLLRGNGRFLAVEVKAPTTHHRGDGLSSAQVAWRGVVERAGGLYVLGTSAEGVLDELRAACR
jgi:hypothetical protein